MSGACLIRSRGIRLGFFLVFCFTLFSTCAAAQQVLYDRYIKVKLPSDWQERRSWELGDDRSLPLYSHTSEAVAFVWGFDRPLYRHGYIESLAGGDRLSRRLEMDLSLWPAEASRYYAMVSGGFTMLASGPTVTVGPTLKPGHVQYLGKIKLPHAQVDLIQYISDAQVDQAVVDAYKMQPDLVGAHAQILFGQATFGHRTQGYTLIACRFAAQPNDIDWIKPLLENVAPVLKADRETGAAAEQTRDALSHAAAVIQDHRYPLALTQLHAVLERSPQDDNALMLQGEAQLHLGKIGDAEKSLRQAIAINPNNDRAHFLLASVLWEQKKHQEALAEWDVVQRLSPLYPRIDEALQQHKAQHPLAATQ